MPSNSDVHDMLMLYVWKSVCKKTNRLAMADMATFRREVGLALYGDDVVKTTSQAVAQWFNGDSISAEVEQLGMKITPGNKTDTEFRIKTIDEVTFLKRKFLTFEDEDFGGVRAPLEKSVIQRMMLWVHKSDDPYEACVANVKGALCEAFFWGRVFFDEMKSCVEAAWAPMSARGVEMPLVTYTVLKQNWMNKTAGDLVPAQFQYRIEGLENVEDV